MEQNTIKDVWIEGQIGKNSINLALLSESQDGARVEELKQLTFDELESQEGELFNLNLSDETGQQLRDSQQSALSEYSQQSAPSQQSGPSRQSVEKGDVLIDGNRGAAWSDTERVVVEDVTPVPANKWYLEAHSDETVADVNPEYPADDIVIEGHYEGSTKTYAFPESRLVEEEPAGKTCTPHWNDSNE